MLLCSQSWLASEGITVQGEVIDSDYRSPVQCLLQNSTKMAHQIVKGESVCQGLFLPVPEVEWIHGQLPATFRNEGGFGSTN